MSSMSLEPTVKKAVITVPALPPIPWTERYFRLLWGLVGIVGFLIIWQLGVVSGLLDRLFVSSPIDVIITAFRLLPSRDFSVHLISTAQCLFSGTADCAVRRDRGRLAFGLVPDTERHVRTGHRRASMASLTSPFYRSSLCGRGLA